jgi:hypothetical protein
MRRVPVPLVPVVVLLAACGGGADPTAEADAPASVDSAPASVTAGEAPGTATADSVVAWANEIRDGIALLPGRVADDPEGARSRAVELYVTRQERIEQAAGPGTGSPADLAESVHEAEARFHELMQLLGESPPPDSAAVGSAVDALDGRLGEVVELAAGAETAAAPGAGE